MRHWELGFLAFTFLGCVAKPLGHQGVLVVRSQVLGGSLTQAINNPYTQASINHLTLKLSDVTGIEQDLGISRDLSNAQLDNPIVFSNLKPNITYRIRAFAYASSGTADLISTSDADSYTDVAVSTDDRPTMATLKVRLIDKTFNGTATSSIILTNGGYSPIASESLALPYTSYLVAGDVNTAGATDATGSSARFNYPFGIAQDMVGNLYTAEYTGCIVRKISPSGAVSTLAGASPGGYSDGTGTSAKFGNAAGVIFQPLDGNIYVADTGNCAIRQITPQGVVKTFAGRNSSGFADGIGTAAQFAGPMGMAIDAAGNLYIADRNNNAIRKMTPTGVVTTIAGNGTAGHADGVGSNALFNYPFGIAVDSSNNLYVTEYNGHCVRKITSSGAVSTIAGAYGTTGFVDGTGTQVRFNIPYGITIDRLGNLFVADCGNNRIRQIDPSGVVTTIAGGGTGVSDGPATLQSFPHAQFVYMGVDGYLYVTATHVVRKLK